MEIKKFTPLQLIPKYIGNVKDKNLISLHYLSARVQTSTATFADFN